VSQVGQPACVSGFRFELRQPDSRSPAPIAAGNEVALVVIKKFLRGTVLARSAAAPVALINAASQVV
jgi:hypothetical protein